jgi:hypothetical protein
MDRRYPIGHYEFPATVSPADHSKWIADLTALPKQFAAVVDELSEAQLAASYRDGGWTVRQVIHHLADSHMNAYCRTRLALTEDRPAVKSYSEQLWAELHDAKTAPVNLSVVMLDVLHERWAVLLESLSEGDWKRDVFVPYFDRHVSVEQFAGLYAWHGRHHLAQIELVK